MKNRCFLAFLYGRMDMTQTKKLTLSAMFLALGLLLPFLTGQIPTIGSMLLPMHIPVLLCGFIIGAPYGLLVGIITPLLRSMIFGMPPMLTAITMAFELGTYGFISGYLYNKLPKSIVNIYVSLIGAMIIGRVVWGMVSMLIYGMGSFGFSAFIAGGFSNAIPGILLQLVLIPILVKLADKK